MREGHGEARRRQIEAAGEKGQEGFARAMQFPNWKTRMRAAHYLISFDRWDLDETFASELLLNALKDRNRRVRLSAINTLIRLNLKKGSRSFAPDLLSLLEDSSRCVRMRTASVLGEYAREVPLNPVLAAMVKENDPRTLKRFQRLIGKILETQNIKL